jgi:Domain of unknown function (DUF4338)
MNSPAEIKAEVADVPDRTLRRWLGELVHEGVIERSGSRKGTRYRWKPTAREQQRLQTVAADTDAGLSTTQTQPVFSPESEQLLKRIDAPLYTRSPVTYSKVNIAAASRRLAEDWHTRYAHRPVLLETFVEKPRLTGTCYKAANWQYVGDTQGLQRSNGIDRS